MGMLRGAARPKAVLLELVEGAREIGHLRDGQVHDGAGARLVGAHAHTRGARLGHDDARRANDLGRSHDGAEVALVRHVVEDDDQGVALPRRVDDVAQRSVAIRADPEHDPLVSAVRGERVEHGLGHALDLDAARRKAAGKLGERRVRASRVLLDEGARDGKAELEGFDGGTTALDEVSPGAATTGIGPLARARGLLLRVPRPALGPRVLLALALVSLGALGAAAPAPAGGVSRSATRRLGAALPSCHG